MSRTKNVLFFVSYVVVFACGPLAAWGDHAGWSGLWTLVIVGVPGMSAAGVMAYLAHDEAVTRLALRDEKGDPVELSDVARYWYEVFGYLPEKNSKR